MNRRQLLRLAGLSAAAAGSGLILPAAAQPTPASGPVDDWAKELMATLPSRPAAGWTATEKNILGPFHRPGALYRAKLTPPLEPGRLLVVSGRVWALDTRQPLSLATLDVWQADDKGHYDNDGSFGPPKANLLRMRARMVTDELGRYEFETIHPGRYKISDPGQPDLWRPEHIHYMVSYPGYKTLITQLYFEGDPYNGKDEFIRPSLIMKVVPATANGTTYDTVTFDIVLSK